MRSDVKNLLDRLGKSQFRYKEFSDRFSDLETWPVFEAVIRDPRVFNSASKISVQAASSSQPVVAPIGSVLSRKYGADDAAAPARSSGDVRTLLSRISSAVEKGTI
ncbi:hypothetical protein OVA07_07625 [Novosphingobium sp. SL115]|uniref:hypothetical protein n=1 Tax=Novosphingobium sp. SL115 TaxID=2995150 RepID=UPI0022734CE4|nr:hypothetical protein [Novosphingobium sp. SL115]MCY1670885.1 hypothetical protein [Novosphingobium sp. SL115]